MSIKSPKKLIEVALPLDDINEAAAKEKSIRHGHPSTLHLWWARRPLAAARAVIFAQMVNDPGGERGYYAGKTKQQANHERERLFGIMRRLVKWENTTNESVLAEARAEIMKSWRETCELNKGKPGFDPNQLPAFHDPFAGGGAIPLEAQRLGLEAHARDLNPVAVLINKAMVEIPPLFSGRSPVGPIAKGDVAGRAIGWLGGQGLAEDVRRYGMWMRDEAVKRLEQLYPKVVLDKQYGGGEATVIAWLWARTVKSPNPAFCHVDVPLASNFVLAAKSGKEVFVSPVIDEDKYTFEVKKGKAPKDYENGTKLARGAKFECILSKTPIDPKYIYTEARAGRMGAKLMAVVVEGKRGRIYLPPSEDMERLALDARASWKPEIEMPENPRWFSPPLYGLRAYGDIFTQRQLIALSTFSDLVKEVTKKVVDDARAAGWADDGKKLDAGGCGATAYADAIAVYLSFAIDRMAMTGNTLVRWNSTGEKAQHCFGRQALPMLWDFAEVNFLGTSTGSFEAALFYSYDPLNYLLMKNAGTAEQEDARAQRTSMHKVVSTDPPYYDNIGYADLSDFFYVWLRKSLRQVFPGLFSTMAVPKAEELIATPYRHGGKDSAEKFFMSGMTEAMNSIAEKASTAFPTTIYYAFKQSDTNDAGTTNTGWETFLEAVLKAGFYITGTWPLRTEMRTRQVAQDTNALASSIVMVCRKRDINAGVISRKEFIRELREVLPAAMEDMLNGGEGRAPIAPVDLSQAIIGPGMSVFSKYNSVIEADGSPMSVHTALLLINKFLDEGEDFDSDTRFCLGWFQQYGWATGQFGTADVLARSKGTTVDHIANAGVVESGGGKVRLLKIPEYPAGWDPRRDVNMPIWEALHHLIKALSERGVEAAGALAAKMPDRIDAIRQLAYRLYTLCERKGWAEDARAYNTIITSWSQVDEASQRVGHHGTQITMDV